MASTLRFSRMALSLRLGSCCQIAANNTRTLSATSYFSRTYQLPNNAFPQSLYKSNSVKQLSIYNPQHLCAQTFTKRASTTSTEKKVQDDKKLGLFARFKKMYKEYWYVLVPVHVVTSAFWFGGFYYASTSGVDIIAILEWMGISDTIINPLRDSSMGHVAIAYILYKIATPIRYTVTLGGTTISIKYLSLLGYIKPVPTKEELIQMYQDRRDGLQEKLEDTKLELKVRKNQIKERKRNIMDDYKHYKQELKKIQKKEEEI